MNRKPEQNERLLPELRSVLRPLDERARSAMNESEAPRKALDKITHSNVITLHKLCPTWPTPVSSNHERDDKS